MRKVKKLCRAVALAFSEIEIRNCAAIEPQRPPRALRRRTSERGRHAAKPRRWRCTKGTQINWQQNASCQAAAKPISDRNVSAFSARQHGRFTIAKSC
jgi:hypothetical protein